MSSPTMALAARVQDAAPGLTTNGYDALDGAAPAEMFRHAPRLRVAKSERLAIFNWIWQSTQRRLSAMDTVNQRSLQTAWRHAAESWLHRQRLIAVNYPPQTKTNKNQLLPLFSKKWPH